MNNLLALMLFSDGDLSVIFDLTNDEARHLKLAVSHNLVSGSNNSNLRTSSSIHCDQAYVLPSSTTTSPLLLLPLQRVTPLIAENIAALTTPPQQQAAQHQHNKNENSGLATSASTAISSCSLDSSNNQPSGGGATNANAACRLTGGSSNGQQQHQQQQQHSVRYVPAEEVDLAVKRLVDFVGSVDLSSVGQHVIFQIRDLIRCDAFKAWCGGRLVEQQLPLQRQQHNQHAAASSVLLLPMGERFAVAAAEEQQQQHVEQRIDDIGVEEEHSSASLSSVATTAAPPTATNLTRVSSSSCSRFVPPTTSMSGTQMTNATATGGGGITTSTMLPTSIPDLNRVLNGGVPAGNIVDIVPGRLDDVEYDAAASVLLSLRMMTRGAANPTAAAAYVVSCSRNATVLFARAAAEMMQQNNTTLPAIHLEELYANRRRVGTDSGGILDALPGIEARMVCLANPTPPQQHNCFSPSLYRPLSLSAAVATTTATSPPAPTVRYLVILDLDTATQEDSAALSVTSARFDQYTDRVLTQLKGVAQRQKVVVLIVRIRDASDPVDDDDLPLDQQQQQPHSTNFSSRAPRNSGGGNNVASYHAVNCRIRCARSMAAPSPSSLSPTSRFRSSFAGPPPPRPVGIEITKSAWCSTCSTVIQL